MALYKTIRQKLFIAPAKKFTEAFQRKSPGASRRPSARESPLRFISTPARRHVRGLCPEFFTAIGHTSLHP